MKLLLLELPDDVTVASLRKIFERVTKASTNGFRVTSLNHSDLPDDNSIFEQEGIPKHYLMPVLAFNSSIHLSRTKLLNFRCLLELEPRIKMETDVTETVV